MGGFAAISIGMLLGLPGLASATTGGGGDTPGASPGQTPFGGSTQSVCAFATLGYASCLAEVIVPSGELSRLPQFTHAATASNAKKSVAVSGLSPANIDAVYGFSQSSSSCSTPGTAGCGQTIAIVDAYDDP